MGPPFKDHFSDQAAQYAAHRPHYPDALLQWLARISPGRQRAWDCATGNGQAALSLANLFGQVVATDASRQQIANAPAHPNIEYRVEPAEKPSLGDASVDLAVVAQAFHWFDLDAFNPAARRIVRPGGVLAVVAYRLLRIEPAVDAIIDHLYEQHLGPFWPSERRLVEQAYAGLKFPFPLIETPAFDMHAEWGLANLVAYLETWSACRAYRRRHGHSPMDLVAEDLRETWGDADASRTVSWPLTLKVGRKEQ